MAPALALAPRTPADVSVLAVPVFAGRVVPPGAGVELDGEWLAGRRFEGKLGETLSIPADDGSTIVAVGMGDAQKLTAEGMRRGAAALVRAVSQDATVATTLLAAAPVAGLEVPVAAAALAEGASLATYKFVRYKGDPRPSRLERVVVVGSGRQVQASLDRGARVGAAVTLARDLVNEPAGAMTPSRLAEVAAELASGGTLSLEVWDGEAIAREGLGGLAGVARGSDEPPRLIRLEHTPDGGPPRARIGLVGKGITFDSGGLSIKTAEGMETMKTDMSGAAAVLATLSAVPELVPDVAVVGIVPASENMLGGRATKPGDVLTIRNGTTVEVLNTDAEGRLVLADGLSLAVEAGVDAIVDVATLTGACKIALGTKIAGLMGNDDGWVEQVRAAAERAGESVWPLPLPDEYRRSIDSEVADLKNVGSDRWGGALTAGLFLREFVGAVPWAHLDIAGPARSGEDEGYVRKGGTGWGVRTLLELLATCRPPVAGPEDENGGRRRTRT
ncbi:MAG TPA: leucyl aminopeptidase [Acidimicrobiales bacterium]|nr:leucyl aminopeptidase [Acidimicrobiales bacterium]